MESTIALTNPEPLKLATNARAAEREKFDKQMEEHVKAIEVRYVKELGYS
jgi:hypothetical protein